MKKITILIGIFVLYFYSSLGNTSVYRDSSDFQIINNELGYNPNLAINNAVITYLTSTTASIGWYYNPHVYQYIVTWNNLTTNIFADWIDLKNLLPCTEYTVVISAIDKSGNYGPSTILHFKTPSKDFISKTRVFSYTILSGQAIVHEASEVIYFLPGTKINSQNWPTKTFVARIENCDVYAKTTIKNENKLPDENSNVLSRQRDLYENMLLTQDYEISDFLEIYPNPACSDFYLSVKFQENKEYSYEIFNSLGELMIRQENIREPLIHITQTNFHPGVYFIRVTSGKKVKTERLIIQ